MDAIKEMPENGDVKLLAPLIGRRAAIEILRHHPLSCLARIDRESLMRLRHIGPRRAQAILTLPLLLEAISRHGDNPKPVTCSRDIFERYRLGLGQDTRERFLVLVLNARNSVLAEETAAIGSVNTVHVNPAQVLRPAILHSATSLICLHNHPSGDPSPSPEDRMLTERISSAATLLGIRFLDHLIVSAGGYFSFADAGQL